ncbi:unnamed protein product [Linum tenue]|uniref:Uncharacterized protein n=1 Tax=Linum tenue TaxID=586396 RepID=A0AAV0S3N7_9ROSI|nr:unnamed protein product [Linum tenue]CAI0626683.1 unnamed protein product [Linum tenue]
MLEIRRRPAPATKKQVLQQTKNLTQKAQETLVLREHLPRERSFDHIITG